MPRLDSACNRRHAHDGCPTLVAGLWPNSAHRPYPIPLRRPGTGPDPNLCTIHAQTESHVFREDAPRGASIGFWTVRGKSYGDADSEESQERQCFFASFCSTLGKSQLTRPRPPVLARREIGPPLLVCSFGERQLTGHRASSRPYPAGRIRQERKSAAFMPRYTPGLKICVKVCFPSNNDFWCSRTLAQLSSARHRSRAQIAATSAIID